MFKTTFTAALTCTRGLAVVTLAAFGVPAYLDDVRCRRANHRDPDASHPETSCCPDPRHGWLYELSSYGGPSQRLRPASMEERIATDETRDVDGTGIFAGLGDSSIVRSDDADYPPREGKAAIYRWVAP